MATATGIYRTTYEGDLAIKQTRADWARLGVLAVVLVAIPFLASPYWLTVINMIGIAAIGAIGLNILTGFTGQISLGQGGFLGVGAYTAALLSMHAGVPFPFTLIAAMAMTAAVGVLFGLPSLRLKGLYLAIATLAAQFVILWVIRNWEPVTGGTESLALQPVELLGVTLHGDFTWYWIILLFAVLATVTAMNLFRTGLGRAFIAIRDQDIAAEVMGVSPLRFKLTSFAISSAYVGLAGALIAHYRLIVTWERFTFDISIQYLAMIIVGGLGSVLGAILGAALITALPAVLQRAGGTVSEVVPQFQQQLPAIEITLFGLIIVLFLVFEPRGLARIWQRMKDYFRLWPFRY